MANVSSSNTTTLYSTTQEVPITPGAPVSAGTVNDTNFTTLYGQVGSAPNAQNNQTVNNLLVTGSAQINQNLTVLGTTTLNNTTINGQTFPLTDGSAGEVLHTDGSGNLYWAVDDNVTYTIDASATTGGANFNLQGSDASTDTIKFSGSGATTVAQTSANEITISSTDSDTTYTIDASATAGGANFNLQGSDASTDTIEFVEGTGVTLTVPTGSEIEIAIGQDVATTAGVTFDSATLDNYLQINGATSGYSQFTAPATGSNLTYVLPSAAGGANTVLTNDGSGNLSWALPGGGGSTFGNITVGVVTDNTISTTTGDLNLAANSNIVNVSATTINLSSNTRASITSGTSAPSYPFSVVKSRGSSPMGVLAGAGMNHTITNTAVGDLRGTRTYTEMTNATPGTYGFDYVIANMENGVDTTSNPTEKFRVTRNGIARTSSQFELPYWNIASGELVTTTAGTFTLDSWGNTTYTAASYYIVMKEDPGRFRSCRIDIVHDGSTAYMNEHSSVYNDVSYVIGIFNVTISGGQVILEVTPEHGTQTNTFRWYRTATPYIL